MTQKVSATSVELNGALPSKVWGVKLIHGSIMHIEMGEKLEKVFPPSSRWPEGRIYYAGSIFLVLDQCDWAFYRDQGDLLIDDEDISDANCYGAFAPLIGEYLVRLSQSSKFRWIAHFTNGLQIEIAAGGDQEPDDELFWLVTSDGGAIAYSLSGGLKQEVEAK